MVLWISHRHIRWNTLRVARPVSHLNRRRDDRPPEDEQREGADVTGTALTAFVWALVAAALVAAWLG